MNRMEKSKQEYENVPIPKELANVVQNAIKQSEIKRNEPKLFALNRKKKIYKWGLGIAATLLMGLTIGVNTSDTFAMEMQKIPVVRELAKVLTIKTFSQEEEDIKIMVEVPGVEFVDGNSDFSKEINAEISKMCNLYAEEAKMRAEEYKDAFMETGGTKEEWAEHNIEIKVGYTIKNQTKEYLSFSVYGTENWSTAYAQTKYYNLDVKNLKYITLQDLLGDDYIRIANESIQSQMQDMQAKSDVTFWSDEEAFQSIKEDARFYINQAGNPVIVFEKYEIAPGAMGELEFEIER